jgi:hypothetical protein
MSTFRAFQTGLEAGQKQAKVRREDDARMKASEAFSSGNYEGAVSSLMGVGLMQDADAYDQAGRRKQEDERTKTYAQAFKTGLGAGPMPDRKAGFQAVAKTAGEQGDFGMMSQVDQALAGMDEAQAGQFAEGMNFLGQTALSLKGVAPEARGQAAIQAIQNSPYANPQILAQIQQAAADGKITDDELDNFAMQTMSVAERVKLAKGEKPNYTTATTRDGVIAFNQADPNQTVNLGQAPLPASAQGGAEKAPSGYYLTGNPEQPLAPIAGGPADPKRSGIDVDPKIIALETAQSAKWMPIQKDFGDIKSQYGRIEALSKRKDSAGDLGLVVSFTKMLDPGSVARESEVEMTQSAAGALQQAAMWGPRLADGKTLLPDNVRKMFVSAANDMFGVYEQAYEGLARDMQTRATQYGLSPERIMVGYEPKASVKPKVAQNPAMQMGIRAYAAQSGLPAEAITEFLSNPATPQEIAEFNEAFGDGAAEAILKAMQGGR